MRRFTGLGVRGKRKGAAQLLKETAMKRIIQAVVVAALFTGAQAKAEDAPIVVPAQWTHADRLPAGGAQASAFPGASREDPIVVESKSTYTEDHPAGMSQEAVASAFPGAAREDPIVVE